ncbi:MAG: thiamine pyrophosphate-dependent enzyme [Nitriliruptoraceae bacterium]
MDRVAIVEQALDEVIEQAPIPVGTRPLRPEEPIRAGSQLTAAEALAAFEDQVTSRVLDVVARELRAAGVGYYTISSAGHEDDVALGALTRPSDPAFLHYRSGALFVARARRAGDGETVVDDVLCSLLANREDPASGGRHKVWGSRPRWVIPQTSTIGSHLPKAVGAAIAIDRRRAIGVSPVASEDVPDDAIAIASFGDASLNHATAQTAINAARWSANRGAPTPVLFVCEDNGLGISVATPPGWVEQSVSHLPDLAYLRADGELDDVWAATAAAIEETRRRRRPVFLHLRTVRLWGHAGSDVEQAYRPRSLVEADERRDPLLRTARQLLTTGAATREQLRDLIAERRRTVRSRAEALRHVPPLTTRAEVMAPLAPHRPDSIRAELAQRPLEAAARLQVHQRGLPEEATAASERTLAAAIRATLHDELLRRPEALVFGEDVAHKGGVYGVTGGLHERFGPRRVFDTLLDETSILGLAQGAGLLGFLPVPEIQYLAYVHNALDQLRGEAASTAFFSDGAFTSPMVVRIAGLAYQRGFGGHFHNDHALAALREIPGLAVVVPSRPDDAAALLRGALSMAATDGRVIAFVEPIALYHERDLHEPGDEGWLATVPPPDHLLLPGDVGLHGDPDGELLIVTYGNGLRLSLRAARRLADDGLRVQVLDLRWLAPLPLEAVQAQAVGRAVLVVDECRASGGIADAIVADLATAGARRALATVCAADSYIPLGPAAESVLVTEEQIVRQARRLVADLSVEHPRRRRRSRWTRRR